MIYYLDVVEFSQMFLWLFHDFKFVDRFHYRVTKVHEVGAHTKRRRWQMVKFVFQAECFSMYMCVHMCVNLINMWNTHHCIIIIFIPFIALTYTMLYTYPWSFIILKAFCMKLWGPMIFWSMISLQRTSRQYAPIFMSVIRHYHATLDVV